MPGVLRQYSNRMASKRNLQLEQSGASEGPSEALSNIELDNPSLSIVIPCFQEEKLIEKTLSHWAAAFKTWPYRSELIISDGGSTDRTVEIAKFYADKLTIHDSSRGRQTISEGRNEGAALATGDYIFFTNADVELPPQSGRLISELLNLAMERGASTCRVGVHPADAGFQDKAVLGSCDFIFMLMNKLGIGMGRGECHFIRRTLFEELGGYRPDLIAGEDFELYKRVAARLRKSKKKIGFVWGQTLYEDPRRYREIGYGRTLFTWFANTMSVTFKNRSHSKEWTALR